MMSCSICDAHLDAPIYVSSGHRSLTTMMSQSDDKTEVYFCDQCGHLQTREIVSIDEYYEKVYAILADSEEEDQLYKIVEGRQVFQTEHRVNTLFDKLELPQMARVLDLGCAKGLILKEICRRRPDVTPYFFEVSDRYVRYWQLLAEASQWATKQIPESWKSCFDLITSFYVLEHVDDPATVIGMQAELLKPGGTLYFVVPNVYANIADLVVADHLQHYSENSLASLLRRSGLEVIDIDENSHESAFVVAARKVTNPAPFRACKHSVGELRDQVLSMSAFWSELSGRIRAFEREHADHAPACIYGAGFYGNFIASCLENQDKIECFVDQNEYVRRKPMQGKPVVAPKELDLQVTTMYVGLNPVRARAVINDIQPWKERHFDCFYL